MKKDGGMGGYVVDQTRLFESEVNLYVSLLNNVDMICNFEKQFFEKSKQFRACPLLLERNLLLSAPEIQLRSRRLLSAGSF